MDTYCALSKNAAIISTLPLLERSFIIVMLGSSRSREAVGIAHAIAHLGPPEVKIPDPDATLDRIITLIPRIRDDRTDKGEALRCYK